MRSASFCRLRTLLIAFCIIGFGSVAVRAQSATIQEVLKHKADWKKFAEDNRRLQFEARFSGRAAAAFRVDKIDVIFRLPSTIRLPDRMRDKQRLEISGKFVLNSGRLEFLVSSLSIRDTDIDQVTKKLAAIPEDQPDKLLKLADEYVSTAEFYNDEDLMAEIAGIRSRAVLQMRSLAVGNPAQLQKVIDTGKSLGVDPRLLDAVRFQILITDWNRPEANPESMSVKVKKLPGWDIEPSEMSERLRSTFPQQAVANYDSGTDEDRKYLHRLLYVTVRQQQIRAMLKPDGSNGLMLAELIRSEFPDESANAVMFEESEVKYRLGRIPDLSRQELQQLVELLTSLSRNDKIGSVVEEWLRAQEQRFGATDLAGVLRLADEHLFVAEQWKGSNHHKQGVELLKKAWAIASVESPNDALQIAERLKRLGWEHLNDQWMTLQQVEMLPKDDIQLAIREARVVKGMTRAQVTSTLGQPARISRMGSSRTMRELWIYDDAGSPGMVVRFKRSLISKADEGVVEEISRIGSGSLP